MRARGIDDVIKQGVLQLCCSWADRIWHVSLQALEWCSSGLLLIKATGLLTLSPVLDEPTYLCDQRLERFGCSPSASLIKLRAKPELFSNTHVLKKFYQKLFGTLKYINVTDSNKLDTSLWMFASTVRWGFCSDSLSNQFIHDFWANIDEIPMCSQEWTDRAGEVFIFVLSILVTITIMKMKLGG